VLVVALFLFCAIPVAAQPEIAPHPPTEQDLPRLLQQLSFPDTRLRLATLKAIAQIQKDRQAAEQLLNNLATFLPVVQDDDVDVRAELATVLGMTGNPQAYLPLTTLAADAEHQVRSNACLSINSLLSNSITPPDREALLIALLNALGDQEPAARRATARALGFLDDPRTVDALLASVQDEDTRVRNTAIRSLGLLRATRAVEVLLPQLHDREWTSRSVTAFALGEIGDRRAVEPLIAMLQDESEMVVSSAASALANIGDPRAVEPLIACLARFPIPLHAVTGALGTLQDPRAIPPLLEALARVPIDVHGSPNDLEEHYQQLLWASRKAMRQFGIPAREAVLRALQPDTPLPLRVAAADLFAQVPDHRGTPALIAMLRHDDRRVRQSALHALRNSQQWEVVSTIHPIIAGFGEPSLNYWWTLQCSAIDERASSALLPLLSADDLQTTKDALLTIGMTGDAMVLPALLNALHEPLEEVGQFAAKAICDLSYIEDITPLLASTDAASSDTRMLTLFTLGHVGDARAVESLIDALQHDPSLQLRYVAAQILGAIGDTRAVEPLADALTASDASLRQAAAVSLARLGDDRGWDTVFRMLTEGSTAERTQALRAIVPDDMLRISWGITSVKREGYPTTHPEVITPIIDLLEHEDMLLARKAAEVLGALQTREAVPALIQHLPRLRVTAVNALAAIGDQRAAEALLAYLSTERLQDPWFYEMGSAVSKALCRLKDPRAKPHLIAFLTHYQYPAIKKDEHYAALRLQAAIALAQLGDARGTDAVVAALDDPIPAVRYTALIALHDLHDPRVSDVAVRAIQDSDEFTRVLAARLLMHKSDERGLAVLLDMLNHEQHGSPRLLAAVLIGERASTGNRWPALQRSIPSLLPLLVTGKMREQLPAIIALGALHSTEAVPALTAFLAQELPLRRELAARALGQIGHHDAVPALIGMMAQEKSPRLRAVAVTALRTITQEPFGDNVEQWQAWFAHHHRR
jgi:HEAT repeat protein